MRKVEWWGLEPPGIQVFAWRGRAPTPPFGDKHYHAPTLYFGSIVILFYNEFTSLCGGTFLAVPKFFSAQLTSKPQSRPSYGDISGLETGGFTLLHLILLSTPGDDRH